MTEDKFEQFLKKAAQDYNAPSARTPREEMWQAIQAARKAGPHVVYGGATIFRVTGGKRFGSRVWWAAAAAAVVLVASGVGIGRWTASTESPATASLPQRARIGSTPSETAPGDAPIRESGLLGDEDSRAASNRTLNERSMTPDDRGSAAGSVASPGAASVSAYQLAAVNHLSEAEALLTSLKTRSTTDQQLDAQLASWARDLLTKTRLLLDSPVAADMQRRPLLQDLELLLVQIVQLSPSSAPQDREIIEETLKQDKVLIRLRTAIPAGQRGS